LAGVVVEPWPKIKPAWMSSSVELLQLLWLTLYKKAANRTTLQLKTKAAAVSSDQFDYFSATFTSFFHF
jgi:hypothetical protein